ncbi:MAG: sulfurtransferase [Gordonia sp. (in: high G+C Gram-positive bacteria)]
MTISATQLHEVLAAGEPIVILDVRWQLGDDRGHEHYLAGHIPGAIYVDLSVDLADPPSPAVGRHPLPDADRFRETVRRWGIDERSTVVVYDDNAGQSAARAWWLLRWANIARTSILDGGLSAWRAAGFETVAGDSAPPVPAGGGNPLTVGQLPTVGIDEIASTSALVLDARAGERYRGEVEPVDPRAGHIPSAISAPTSENVDADGYFRTPQELRDRFGALGVSDDSEVIVYCGSGVTAAHEIAALAIAGFTATLYPGSWSQWSADQARPVAVGGNP